MLHIITPKQHQNDAEDTGIQEKRNTNESWNAKRQSKNRSERGTLETPEQAPILF